MLSDLRESGGIEGDSDQVLFVYREEYYNPETERLGEAEIIIGKNRHGAEGVAHILWQGSITRFLSRAGTKVVEGKAQNDSKQTPEPPSDFIIQERSDGVYVADKNGVRKPLKLYSYESCLKRMEKLSKGSPGEQSAWWLKAQALPEEQVDAMGRRWAELNLVNLEKAWDEVQARPRPRTILSLAKKEAQLSSADTGASR
jgi:hypothetical protein